MPKKVSDPLATTPLKKILSFLRGPVATQPGIKQSGNIQGPQNFHLFFVPHCMPDSERQKISGILEVVSWQRVRARRVASRRALAVPSQQIRKSNLEDSLNKDAHKRRLLLLFECGAVKVHKQSHEISFNQFCDRRPTLAAPNTRPKL